MTQKTKCFKTHLLMFLKWSYFYQYVFCALRNVCLCVYMYIILYACLCLFIYVLYMNLHQITWTSTHTNGALSMYIWRLFFRTLSRRFNSGNIYIYGPVPDLVVTDLTFGTHWLRLCIAHHWTNMLCDISQSEIFHRRTIGRSIFMLITLRIESPRSGLYVIV